MANARRRDEWDRAASVLSMLYNIHRGKNSKPMGMVDFNPYAEKPKPVSISMHTLRQIMPKL